MLLGYGIDKRMSINSAPVPDLNRVWTVPQLEAALEEGLERFEKRSDAWTKQATERWENQIADVVNGVQEGGDHLDWPVYDIFVMSRILVQNNMYS